MATHKLRALVVKEDLAFSHQVEHDLESFEWVILYAIYQRSLHEMTPGQTQSKPETEAGRLFATASTKTIYQQRVVALYEFAEFISGILHCAESIEQAPQLQVLLRFVAWDLKYSFDYVKLCRWAADPHPLPPIRHTSPELERLCRTRPRKERVVNYEEILEAYKERIADHESLCSIFMAMVKGNLVEDLEDT